jgi:restriction endonuclease Mrr
MLVPVILAVAAAAVAIGSKAGAGEFSLLLAAASVFPSVYVIYPLIERMYSALRKEEERKYSEAVNITAALEKSLKEREAEVEAGFRLEQQERLTRLDHLQALGGHRFEELMTRLFSSMGFSARKTRGSRDGGVDIEAVRGGETVLIQCKNHKYPIGPAELRSKGV